MDDSHDAMLDVLLDEQASTRSLVHEAGVAVDYLSTYRHLQSDLSKLAQTMALHLAEELHTTHEEYDDQYPVFARLEDQPEPSPFFTPESLLAWPEYDEQKARRGGERLSHDHFNQLMVLLEPTTPLYNTTNRSLVVNALRDVLVFGRDIKIAASKHQLSEQVIRNRLFTVRTAQDNVRALRSYYLPPEPGPNYDEAIRLLQMPWEPQA